MAVALTIAGSDSSGGAGIQADLKTFAALGVYGASAITALTAQNTRGVRAIVTMEPAFVAAQIDAVAEDISIGAAKTGMLANAAIIGAVAGRVRAHRLELLVVDPVMVATSGDVLLEADAIESMRTMMFPLAALVTPNLREVEVLTGSKPANLAEMRNAARGLVEMGARAALVKGGHMTGDAHNTDKAIDVLFDGHEFREFSTPRIAVGPVHGAGCTLSAAIAALLARGETLHAAVTEAKRVVTRALETAPAIGKGARPLNHLVTIEDLKTR